MITMILSCEANQYTQSWTESHYAVRYNLTPICYMVWFCKKILWLTHLCLWHDSGGSCNLYNIQGIKLEPILRQLWMGLWEDFYTKHIFLCIHILWKSFVMWYSKIINVELFVKILVLRPRSKIEEWCLSVVCGTNYTLNWSINFDQIWYVGIFLQFISVFSIF